MAKDQPKMEPKELTPFEKFDRLAKKIVRVPKNKIRDPKSKRASP